MKIPEIEYTVNSATVSVGEGRLSRTEFMKKLSEI